ncbi:MAG: proton-conducting transporter membrane subunit, partial [Gammaproteobacteria bacterium]|nr:proton-conducting transporter membrane subunit [Gammaproteobacteria bacterium]
QRSAGHDRIAELGPALRTLPAVAFGMGLAGVALVGLPPSGSFIAKWFLLTESFGSGQWWWAPIVLAGTLLAAAYVFRLLANAFSPTEQPEPVAAGEDQATRLASTGWMIQAPGLLMTLIAVVLLGLGAEPLWDLMLGSDP